jgi:hypothetical protein
VRAFSPSRPTTVRNCGRGSYQCQGDASGFQTRPATAPPGSWQPAATGRSRRPGRHKRPVPGRQVMPQAAEHQGQRCTSSRTPRMARSVVSSSTRASRSCSDRLFCRATRSQDTRRILFSSGTGSLNARSTAGNSISSRETGDLFCRRRARGSAIFISVIGLGRDVGARPGVRRRARTRQSEPASLQCPTQRSIAVTASTDSSRGSGPDARARAAVRPAPLTRRSHRRPMLQSQAWCHPG